ncbi:zinc dependent phospholipase C family protein [Granulicella sp. S190]|uniref:zinc dependent phospholipase C family protein n=1 Tax=Granulicella sp. S190 TaxID=1747226 RepID=UPI00131EC823|nr:zinc dependent phospholipase C family protein [Granulicella sp. S190]
MYSVSGAPPPQPEGTLLIRTRARTGLLKTTALLALLLTAIPAVPYSVQTHQALIDLAWKQSIRPLLLKKFPTLTESQLQEAHAYAYGGSAIQDFGYYPFGNAFFSDLTHYVRSGDFVLSLLHNAHTPDELAFAVGSLSHYIGDNYGHKYAVNQSVPVEFPKLETKYGTSVNYAEDPHAHVQTEFAFDVNQLSKLRFAPSAYTKFVGLEVPQPLLRKAFFETYGLRLPDIIGSKETSIRIYRYAVRRFLPNIARAETLLHKKNFPTDLPSPDLDTLANDLHQAAADNNWEAYRKKPGIRSHLYAGFIFILPKIGTLKLLAIKGPNQQTEDLYIKSVNHSISALRLVLANYDNIGNYIANRDLDTGDVVKPGAYRLADETYAKLLATITKNPANVVPFQLKHDLIAYYADPQSPIETKKNPQKWAQLQANLQTLASMKTIGELDPVPDEVLSAD